ncbi:MAG: SAM hydrolase/SAM-dependent halogenase family protein [Candidatus Ranarchaeia archaeon]
MSIIALLTDFGQRDSYLSEVKASILNVASDTTLIDICHNIAPGDIWGGSWLLYRASVVFPENTIFLAIIDPGVGSARAAIGIMTYHGFFVGPDNGLLSLAADRMGVVEVREISNRRLWREKIAPTFHGRDIFGPVAAYFASGGQFKEIGPKVTSWIKFTLPKPTRIANNEIQCEIIWIDRFGTLITNLRSSDLGEITKGTLVEVIINSHRIHMPFVKTFSDVPEGTPCIVIDSDDWISVAVNGGSAQKMFDASRKDRTRFKVV